MWTYFEASVLGTSASGKAILDACNALEKDGKLDEQSLLPYLDYFRLRYVGPTGFTHHFDGLLLRKSDNPQLVENVLLAKPSSIAERFAAALIIVYRYRNNLFHGLKWAYGIQGQRENFERATMLLQLVLECRQ